MNFRYRSVRSLNFQLIFGSTKLQANGIRVVGEIERKYEKHHHHVLVSGTGREDEDYSTSARGKQRSIDGRGSLNSRTCFTAASFVARALETLD